MSCHKKLSLLRTTKSLSRIFLASLTLIFLTSACASHKPKESQEASNPKIRINATELTGGQLGSIIEKDLITIIITPTEIVINDKRVRNFSKLQQELQQYRKPVITIRAHKCADTKLTTDVMSLAQTLTDTPIPYGSYGDYSDPLCKH